MSVSSLRQIIETRFGDQFSATPNIAWPNTEFDPREVSEWVRFSTNYGQSDLSGTSPDTRFYRRSGVIFVQIFVNVNIGQKRALEIADEVESIWSGWSANGVVIQDTIIEPVGEDDGWYQVNVSAAFYHNYFV